MKNKIKLPTWERTSSSTQEGKSCVCLEMLPENTHASVRTHTATVCAAAAVSAIR